MFRKWYRKMIDWMDRYILRCPLQGMVALLFLVTACGSHKNSVKGKTESDTSVSVLSTDSFSGSRQGNTRIEESFNETTTTTHVEYDTSLPVLESTGKPPVKSEETTTRHREALRNTEENRQSEMAGAGSVTVNKDERTKESEQTKDSVTSGYPVKILLIVSIVLLLVIVLWLIKRKPH